MLISAKQKSTIILHFCTLFKDGIMSKKNQNNDISPEELLEQLKNSFELDRDIQEEIELPKIPDVSVNDSLSPEERFRSRRNSAARTSPVEPVYEEAPAPAKEFFEAAEETPDISEVPTVIMTESEPVYEEIPATVPAEEPVYEEAPVLPTEEPVTVSSAPKPSDTREVPTVPAAPKPASTMEFEKVDSKKAAKPQADISSDDPTDIDIDALMKKYLSDAEYQEVLRNRRDTQNTDLAIHISEAEEYVNSIENQIEKEGPATPTTETQKVLQNMEIPHMTSDDEQLDETDINLMIAFGMQDQLEEKLGEENAQVIEEALKKDAEEFAQIKRESELPGEIDVNMEYTHSSQIRDVFYIYKKQYRNMLFKIFASIGCLALVFLFENFTALGGKLPTWLDPKVFPVIHTMVSLQLLTLSCALAIRPILDGIKGLFTAKPSPDSILSIMVIGSVAYHIGVCFVYDGSSMLFCNTATVLAIFISLVTRLFNLKRDIFSFNIISSKRVKYTISQVPDADTIMEHEAFDEYIDEDSSVFRVTKTGFVDGFFKRTRAYGRNKGILGGIIPICILLTAFIVIYVGLLRNDWFTGARLGYLLLLLSLPVSSFVTYTYPLYRASKTAFDMGSAIIGEESLDEYANAGVISFDDKDVFPSQKTKVKSIKIFGNNRIDKVIYNVASLFKVLGGPLCDVFNIATKDFECSDDVEIVDISEDGLEAVISGKHIFYGKASYLHKNNFEPVYEFDDEKIEFSGEACISYLVCNDEVAAKLYISYGIDPDFISISKQLYRAGMCIGIKSFDPNIDDSLLGKYINMSKYALKVLKCRFLTEKTVTEDRGDSGIVSKKSPKSLLKTLALCDKVNSVSRGSFVIKVLSILLAFAITGFIMFKGVSSYDFAGGYIALYQLFWMIPIFGISLINIKK